MRKLYIKVTILILFYSLFFNFLKIKEVEAGCRWIANNSCMPGVAGCEVGGADAGGCLGHCATVGNYDCNAGEIGWCAADTCVPYGVCVGDKYCCAGGDTPSGCSCFLPDTKISISGGEKNIQDLKVGEKIKSYDIEKNKEADSVVEKIYETTRSGYYKIKLKDGTVLKVTGEHPLWAIQKKAKPLSFWQYLKTESLLKKGFDFLQDQIRKF
ncbi:MAG: Hint domain-containing protein [Candidatus Heimdallarchaeaceae archaeon]